MKTPIQRTESYLDRRFSACLADLPDNAGSEIVAGYSFKSESNESETRALGPSRPLVDILYIKIIADARLTEVDEAAGQFRLVESRRIFKSCITAFDGKLAQDTGDTVFAEFVDADSALRCAIMIRHAFRYWNTNHDSVKRVHYRIGICVCEASADRSDFCSKTVGLSSRLEGLAHTSGICVSPSVRARIREKSKIRFFSMGKGYLKNVGEPVEVFWIEVDAAGSSDVNLPALVKVSTRSDARHLAANTEKADSPRAGFGSHPDSRQFAHAFWQRIRVFINLIFILGWLSRFTKRDA